MRSLYRKEGVRKEAELHRERENSCSEFSLYLFYTGYEPKKQALHKTRAFESK